MKKQRMMGADAMTFRQGCKAYLLNSCQSNLREGTINHDRQRCLQFHKRIDHDMQLAG